MIYLLCSTIRPTMFKHTHTDWITKCDNPSNIITKVVVDTLDESNQLSEYDCVVYSGTNNIGITKPLTQLTKSLIDLNDDDIIIVMSDDFYPPDHWDTILIDEYCDFTGALIVNDGITSTTSECIITIPIMDYKTLKMLNNIVYHPAYLHMYSDNELFDNLSELNVIKNVRHTSNYIFEHRHWTNGKRTLDKVDKLLHDKTVSTAHIIYNERKHLSLSDKLIYNGS